MTPKFQLYLIKIGATKLIQDRVEYFHRLCSHLAFQPLIDIFIDEYLTQDKTRVYEGLSFYSKDFNFSIPNFLTSEEIGILAHHNVQDRIAITVKNFDFRKANNDSLMSVGLSHDRNSTGEYKASQENCMHLVAMLRKYARPYLKKREI